MTKYDYKALGLRCGLELHQQLNTKKLFCNCDSKIITEDIKPDFILKKRLRPILTKTQELDTTAFSELKKQKTHSYYFYNSSNCLVDIDSQPPNIINHEALRTAIILSHLTNSTLVDQSIVMRKQVVDGSNLTGFQRTAMISTQGYLDFDFGKVRVDKILLEEDSARAIERLEEGTIYSLDRAGIPLIELVVWHDMTTPSQVKEVARGVGNLFRLTGFAKRGLGSIRQDINISIKNGNRTEIKGCQELDLIPEIVDREIERQLKLLEVKDLLLKKGLSSFTLESKDLSHVFQNTSSKAIKSSLNHKKVYGFLIKDLKGILGFEVQPNRRVGSELANYIKAKTSLKGLFHSDELPNYGISKEEVEKVKEVLSLSENDAFILVISSPDEIDLVKDVLEKRLNQFLEGVPKETRLVIIDGNTEFARELSGSARMFEETDLPPLSFSEDLLEDAKKNMPLSLDERKDLYLNKFKISEQLANKMYYDNYAIIFENIVNNHNRNPVQVAVFLLEDLITLSRDKKIVLENISSSEILEFFSFEDFETIPKSRLLDVFVYFVNQGCSVSEAISDLKIFDDLSKIDVDTILDIIFKENEAKIKALKERSMGLLMGEAMKASKGLVDGKLLSAKIRSKLQDFLDS